MPAIQGDIREGRNEEEKQALAQGTTRVRSGDRRGTCRVHLRPGPRDPGSHHTKVSEALPDRRSQAG
jgi:hypothetical protein